MSLRNMSLRKRIERDPRVTGALGALAAAWVRLCRAAIRWEVHGEADLARALATGPVVLVFWHEALTLPAALWRPEWGPISAVHGSKFAGRVVGAFHERLGFRAFGMASRAGNLAASREVLRRVRGGASVGLTGDGPQGPARVLKDAPLDWARASGRPVFVVGVATSAQRRLPTWDRMAWPMPWGRGVAVWRPWRDALPRRADAAATEALRADLAAAMDAAMAEARLRLGQ